MNLRVFIFFMLVALVGPAQTSLGAGIPTSGRAKKAIERRTPTLNQALAEKGLEMGAPVFIRIFKESDELEVFLWKDDAFQLFKTYKICTFSGDLGPKTKEGDRQAPEGFYFVRPGQLNPHSSYHLSFNLGYPNAYDRHYQRTGNYLMVHGDCVSIGCYAMTDKGIEEIWTLIHAAFEKGQPFFRVHAFPFRMTEANMTRHQKNQWQDFWLNLKEGYDYFEEKAVAPNVEVIGGRYIFNDPS